MTSGQIVRVKCASRFAQDWNIDPAAEGTVICRYRLLSGGVPGSERLDVKFSRDTTIWGGPAEAFEIVADKAPEPALA